MRSVIVLTLLLLACGGKRPSKDSRLEVDSSEYYWCFRADTSDGAGALLACAAIEETCVRARGMALRWGQSAKVSVVGPCAWLEVSP